MNTVRLVRVLASFPSDVADEATALDSIANELNRTIGDAHGIRFEIMNWLRDVRAGSGVDVQEVVNQQIAGQYDIIVATFWARAGTPTPRAESGSIEEVKAAVALAKTSGSLPFVLVYMKSGGADLLQVDPEQIRVLANFRKWLSENGVLYKPFHDRASYEALLRVELAKAGSDIAKNGVRVPSTHLTDQQIEQVEDELGLLDYMDMQESGFARMAELMEGQGQLLNRLTESTRRDTADADKILAGEFDRTAVRRLLRRSSESLNSFVDSSESSLLALQQATGDGFDSLAMALSLGASSSEEAKRELVEQLEDTVRTARDAAESTKGLRNSHAGFPRMTAEHNRAKRRVVDVLDRWVAQFERSAGLAEEIIESIRKPPIGIS